MTTLWSDSFTRADSADLGTNWDVQTGCGAWKIASNAAQPGALTGSNKAENYNAVSIPADNWIQATATGAGNETLDAGVGLMTRCSVSAETFYMGFSGTGADGSGNFNEIYLAQAGVYTRLTRTSTGGALANNDVLYLEAVGSAIAYKRNGSTVASASDSTLATGRHGLILSTDAAGVPTLDTASGGDFASATALPWAGMNTTMMQGGQQ